MTYTGKYTKHQLPCLTTRDIRASWTQDGSTENIKRLGWLFYYYGSEVYKQGRSGSHGDWVERKVMTKFNIAYVQLSALARNQRTCVQQLYSKKMNDIRTNILRRGKDWKHTSMLKKEQPKGAKAFRKNSNETKPLYS